MAFSVLITLPSPGADTGPFALYSNIDGYLASFESGVSKASLVSGYLSTLVPNGTTIIRVKSTSIGCQNYVDLTITGFTTTTTTSSTSSTTSTTTTVLTNTFTGSITVSNGSGSGQVNNIALGNGGTPFSNTLSVLSPGVPSSSTATISPSTQNASVVTFIITFTDTGANTLNVTNNLAFIGSYSPVITNNGTTNVTVTWTIPSSLGTTLALSGELDVTGG